MKKISMTLSTDSITAALRVLRSQKREIDKKMGTVCKVLAEHGRDVAQAEYDSAQYDGNNRTVTVTVSDTDRGSTIIASGPAVAFIEFGAGATYGSGYPGDTEVPPGIPVPGSWSLDPTVGKGHYADPNGWYYAHGKKTWGNPPAKAMYQAGKKVQEDVKKVAREVFSK